MVHPALAVADGRTSVVTEKSLPRHRSDGLVTTATSDAAEAQMGLPRSDSLESTDAAGRLSNDCPSLQSAVDIPETDDGK
jgi:hypothetical protein